MTYKNDQLDEKKLYSISEVAEMFDVNISLIRHWSNYFDILKPKTNKKGNRFYTTVDIDNIKIIYNLVKDRGIHLKEAQKYIKNNRFKAEKTVIIVEKLLDIRTMLSEVLLQLEETSKNKSQNY